MGTQNRIWGIATTVNGGAPIFVSGHTDENDARSKAGKLAGDGRNVYVGLVRTHYFADGQNHKMSANDMAGEIILNGKVVS